MSQMIRFSKDFASVVVDTVLADSGSVDIGMFASGQVYVPSGSALTTLTFHSAPNSSGVYLPAQTGAGAALTLTVEAGKCYPIPATIFGAALMKMTGNADGVVHLSLKS